MCQHPLSSPFKYAFLRTTRLSYKVYWFVTMQHILLNEVWSESTWLFLLSIQSVGICRHYYSEAAALLFLDKVVLQYYYADTCHGYTVHRREWGLHVFWSWIYGSRWIVQAKNLLSHLSMLSSPCVIFFWNDEATDRLDWVGFQQYLWRSSFKHHDQILTTQPKKVFLDGKNSHMYFSLHFKFNSFKATKSNSKCMKDKLPTRKQYYVLQ